MARHKPSPTRCATPYTLQPDRLRQAAMGRHRSSPTRCATPYTLYFTAPPGLLHDRLRSAICSAFYFLNLHLNTSPLVSRDSPIRRFARGVETARDHSFAASYSGPDDDLVLPILALHQLVSHAVTSDDSEIQAASGRHSTSLTRSASLTTLLQVASGRHSTSLTRSASLTTLQTSSLQTPSRSRNICPNLDHTPEEGDLLFHIEQTNLRAVYDAGPPTAPVPPSSSRAQGCSYETSPSPRFNARDVLRHAIATLQRQGCPQTRHRQDCKNVSIPRHGRLQLRDSQAYGEGPSNGQVPLPRHHTSSKHRASYRAPRSLCQRPTIDTTRDPSECVTGERTLPAPNILISGFRALLHHAFALPQLPFETISESLLWRLPFTMLSHKQAHHDKHAMNIARALDGQNLQYRKDKFRMSLRVPFHFVLSTLTANMKTSLHYASILFQGSATHAKPGSTYVFSHSSADGELTYMFWRFYTEAEPLTAIEMSSDAIQITNLPAEQRIHQEPAASYEDHQTAPLSRAAANGPNNDYASHRGGNHGIPRLPLRSCAPQALCYIGAHHLSARGVLGFRR